MASGGIKPTLCFNQQDETKGDYEKILVALCGRD